MFMEPTTRQITFQENKFDEKVVLEHAKQDISHVVSICEQKLPNSKPHALLHIVRIDADPAHRDGIIEIYQNAVKEENRRLRQNGTPIHVSITNGTGGEIYFVAGTHEPIEMPHMEFPLHLDLSRITPESYLQVVQDMTFAPEEKTQLVKLIPILYQRAEQGEVDLANIIIQKDEQGNLFTQHQSQEEALRFELTEPNYLQMKALVEQRAGKPIEQLIQNPEELFQASWQAFNTVGEYRLSVRYVNNQSNFSFADIHEGDIVGESSSDPLKTMRVGHIVRDESDCKEFIDEDGAHHSIYFDGRKIQLYDNLMVYDNQTGTDIRFPNQTWEGRKGDCDEVVTMMVAFFKKSGYQGQISMAAIDFAETKEGHAFLLNFKDKTGSKLLFVDPTSIRGFAEVQPVMANGQIDWKKTAEAAYRQQSGKFTVKNVEIYSGFEQVAAYCYDLKSKHLFDGLLNETQISDTSSFSNRLSEPQFAKFEQIFNLVQLGLAEDNNNTELLARSSKMKIFWIPSLYSKYGSKRTAQFLAESVEEAKCASELAPNNASYHYLYAQTNEIQNLGVALEQMSIALELDKSNPVFQHYFKMLLDKNE